MTPETTGPLEKKKLSHIHVFLLVGKFIKLFLWRIFNLQRGFVCIYCATMKNILHRGRARLS